MMFAVSFADVASPTTVVPITAPADSVTIVPGEHPSYVVINGVEYTYVAITEQAKWSTPSSPVFWARIYGKNAYLFSMLTGAFMGKFDIKDLSYVIFSTDGYMQNSFVPLVKAA